MLTETLLTIIHARAQDPTPLPSKGSYGQLLSTCLSLPPFILFLLPSTPYTWNAPSRLSLLRYLLHIIHEVPEITPLQESLWNTQKKVIISSFPNQLQNSRLLHLLID